MSSLKRNLAVVLAALAALVFMVWMLSLRGRSSRAGVRLTAGELQVVHAEVTVKGESVHGVVRLGIGDKVDTGDDGRGRIRLDDGASVILDRGTRVAVADKGIVLESGRMFVQGGATGRTEVTAGDATTVVSSSAAAFERHGGEAKVYCANGELVIRLVGGRQERVQSGETGTLSGSDLKVAPEKAFNDWTGGMATPWSAAGTPRPAIGACWGHAASASPDDPGSPLAIRAHEVDAHIEGEVAFTRVETTYFHGGSFAIAGDFRMAVPEGAVVSRFALRRGDSLDEGSVYEGKEDNGEDGPRLEWAGGGWVRGVVPSIEPGAVVGVIVEYVEWLSPATERMTYRYPMVSDGPPPLLGEFRARIDTHGARPRGLSVSAGAIVDHDVVELRKADFRPQADLVVEIERPANVLPGGARAYVVGAPEGDLSADPYVLVRADLPPERGASGVTLAMVVDTSWSVDPALLDTERAVVESIVEGLGARDRLVVLAADQIVVPVGPAAMGPVDAPRRKAIRDALTALRPGGATDLASALERAADLLPADATAAMVVYVGDGFPTIGETDVEAIRRRLGRRAGGTPRLGAITVGPSANRSGMGRLVQRGGPVLSVADRGDASRVAVGLLATALEPALEDVTLDLGTTVDRVYPRLPTAAPFGTTIMAVGRMRGEMPAAVNLRYRRAGKLVEERRGISSEPVVDGRELYRRWGKARIDELAVDAQGTESLVDIAVRSGLLTPWTTWFVGTRASSSAVHASPLGRRMLEPDDLDDLPFVSRLYHTPPRRGALLEPQHRVAPALRDSDLRALVESSARRAIDDAMAGVRKCRDMRVALRPQISGTLQMRLSIDGHGRATSVSVKAAVASDDDALLDRCVQVLVASISFFESGASGTLIVEHTVALPPARDARRTQCSIASTLPLMVRRSVWGTRLSAASSASAAPAFVQAKQACELPTWTEQRAFLDLMLGQVRNGTQRVALARGLETAGEVDAAKLVRRAAVRDAATPDELAAVRQALIGDEPLPGAPFLKAYKAVNSNEQRLGVVRRFLRAAPHDGQLRRQELALLEALGARDELANEVFSIRQDPFADAAVLADGASALRRVGRGDDGRRAFGELVERAPRDPYARAYVGDRLREEGLYDDAVAAYEALGTLLPGDPSVAMRLALAHAGAGRLDVATRILDHVVRTGGRGDDAKIGELASVTTGVLLAHARLGSKEDAARIDRRALEVPLPDVASVILVQGPALDEPFEASILRADGAKAAAAVVAAAGATGAAGAAGGDKAATKSTAKDGVPPDLVAPSMGLYAVRVERGDKTVRLRLSRPAALDPARPIKVRVAVLVPGELGVAPRLVEKDVDVGADGHPTEMTWNGEVLL